MTRSSGEAAHSEANEPTVRCDRRSALIATASVLLACGLAPLRPVWSACGGSRSEGMAIDDGPIDAVDSFLLDAARARRLFVSRARWPRSEPIRARLGFLPQSLYGAVPFDFTLAELRVFDGNDTIVWSHRFSRGLPRPATVWVDPTFQLPWDTWRDGKIPLRWQWVQFGEFGLDPTVVASSKIRSMDLSVLPVDEPGELITPVPAAEVWTKAELAVDSSLIVRGLAPRTLLRTRLRLGPTWRAGTVACGADLVVLADDAVVGRFGVWLDPQLHRDRDVPRHELLLIEVQHDSLPLIRSGELSAVLVSSPSLALRDFEATQYVGGGARIHVTRSPKV